MNDETSDHLSDEFDDADDEPIIADSIGGPQDVRSPLDHLSRRAVAVVLDLLRRANRFAAGVLIFSAAACVVGYLLGLAALDDGARNAWIVIGGVLAAWAIGSVLLAMWRLATIGRASGALVGEVRSMIGHDRDSERTVIETVEVTEESDNAGVVQVSRQFFTLRDRVNISSYPQLALALASITRFPAMMAIAVVIGFGFVAISMIFILMLIF